MTDVVLGFKEDIVGTLDSKSALFSTGIRLSHAQAPPSAPSLDGGPGSPILHPLGWLTFLDPLLVSRLDSIQVVLCWFQFGPTCGTVMLVPVWNHF
ncbi:hypothetical protein PoB_004681700 [Plakobranchus ocellatus]|uniref:Uncharacterized protein n=1 Tax=Plakobranchus ocellatus TaxID=259542 RepID=A0AAV4BN07_9GAST|nr:hypothetical protein PoB_004681700 [Plakobranchus ocellatus]